MEWQWAENSILNRNPKNADCKETFHAATDEFGRYYKAKGFQYFPSRPKVVYKDRQIKLELCFWSSRCNSQGRTVWLEILPNFYAPALRHIGNKGFLLGHTDFFWAFDENGNYKCIIHEYALNVCGLTVETFLKTVDMLDHVVMPWIEKLKTYEGLKEMLGKHNFEHGGNSVLREYAALYFPELAAEFEKNFI